MQLLRLRRSPFCLQGHMAPNRDPSTGRFTSGGGGGEGFNLGTAYGAVVIDASGVGRAMNEAAGAIGRGVQGIGDRISSVGDSFSRLGGAISTFSAPIALAGGVGVNAAADFDVLMKQIEVFGNVAPDQLSKVSDFALKMGADTKFSSSDAASALLDLLKSGQSLEQAMATLPDVLNLAAVGGMGLAESAGIVSSGLAIYQLKATDAARVSNALARAANASRADVRDLGQALTAVGPVASNYGMTIEDTAAALAVMAQNGTMGSEAGTALKSVLLNMHRPTQDVKDALGDLGLNLYDAQGNARDFNDILKDLDGALDKLPVEDQNRLMQTLGGSYGVVGLSALRAAGGLDSMKASMQAAPAAIDVAAKFMETFRGKVESARGSVETFMITALTPFMNEVLAPMADRIITVVNAMTEWAKANPELTKQIVSVLAVVATLGTALLVAGKAISAVGTVIKIASSPLGLWGVALYGLYQAFQTNFLGIRDFLEPIIGGIVDAFSYLFNDVLGEGKGGGLKNLFVIFEDGSSIIGEFLSRLLGVSSDVGNQIVLDISTAAQGIGTAVTQIIDFLGGIWAAVSPTLGMLANWFINDALPAIVDVIVNHVVPAVQSFTQFLADLWSIVGPHLQNLANWFIQDALPAVLSFISETVIPGIGKFVDFLVGIWDTVSPYLLELADWFLNTALPNIVTFVQDTVIPGVQDFVDILEGIWRVVEPALTSLGDWFTKDALPAVSTAVTDFQTNIITPLSTLLSGLWNAIKPGLEPIYNWFRDSFQWIGTNFIQPIATFISDLITKAGQALDMLRQIGGGAPNQTSAQIIQNGLPANMRNGIPFRDIGGVGMAGQAYRIGAGQLKNEVYIPGADGQFVAGFVDLMKDVAAGQRGGIGAINVMMPAEALASPAIAESRGRDFGRGLAEEMISRGIVGGIQ
jgi:TP901 family phage tail tape measure protein